jgi:hypothetical protein
MKILPVKLDWLIIAEGRQRFSFVVSNALPRKLPA